MPKPSSKPGIIYCFVDTNTFLHFRAFDEVDWPQLLGCHQVYLILARIVIRELDQKKTDPRLSNRARGILTKINGYLPASGEIDSAVVRPGVTLREFNAVIPSSFDWEGQNLDAQVNDDRLIASMLLFHDKTPQTDIRVASADRGILRSARAHGFTAFNPDGKIKPLEVSSEEGKKVTDLEKQLAETRKQLEETRRQIETATKRIPKLEFGLSENGILKQEVVFIQTARNSVAGQPLQTGETRRITDEQIAERVEQERKELDDGLANASTFVSREGLQRLRKKTLEYIEKLPAYLKMNRSRQYGRYCTLSFVLSNIGTVEATDIRIWLRFPDGSFVFDPSRSNNELVDLTLPDKPEIPQRSSSAWGSLNGSLGSLLISPSRPTSSPPPPERQGPLYDTYGDRSVVGYLDKKLFAGRAWSMPPVVAYLMPDFEEKAEVTFSIVADGLPGALEGKLTISWRNDLSGIEASLTSNDQ